MLAKACQHHSRLLLKSFQNDAQMGTSRLLRANWQKCQSPGGKPGENHVFSLFFLRIFWSKPIPKPLENPSDHFEPVSASLDHSQPILHRFYIFNFFLKNKSHFFQVYLKYFLFFLYFLSSGGSGTTPKL